MADVTRDNVVRSYRDLHVWQRAMALARSVYEMSRSWSADERFGLTSQARRASVSIAANIAEGHGRYGRAEFARFVAIANGSLCELETLLELSTSLGFNSPDVSQELLRECREIGNMLHALYRSLTRSNSHSHNVHEEGEPYNYE